MAEEITLEEKTGFFDRIRMLFTNVNKEENAYQRRLLDRRIERFLDENFDSYIEEYGLVREIDLKKYEERYEELVERIAGLKNFVRETDAEIGNLERRLEAIKKVAGPKKR